MRLVIFGPQGAGKGTQSARIAEKFGIPPISTGEIFRWAIKGRTSLGNEVLKYVNEGRLVPDELTIRVVSERIAADDCADGFLLDGFPRNLVQAAALDELLSDSECSLDAAVVLHVPEDVALRRLTGRRVCPDCGRNYHVDEPPESNWTCDNCGGKVVARADDVDEAALKERLRTYHDQTEPLHEYYEKKGLLRQIDGTLPPDEVFAHIIEALG